MKRAGSMFRSSNWGAKYVLIEKEGMIMAQLKPKPKQSLFSLYCEQKRYYANMPEVTVKYG
jgi:hypothetical protein